MRRFLTLGSALAALTLAPLASAEMGPPDTSAGKPAPKEGGGFLAGAKVGGIFSFGGLSPFVLGGVEVGYVAPWLHRSFAVTVNLDYTAPSKSGAESDPRIMTGGKYPWHLTEQELNLMPVVMYRMTFLGRVTPYVGVGPRIYFLKSTVRSGEGMPTFQETTEKSSKVGVGVPLGAEIGVGPGGFTAELLFQYGTLDHTATGASNTGAASISVGYRFLL
jgi:opacity protein-like surface antigen